MHLDDREIGRVQRVENRDRGMCQRAGVDDDALGCLTRLMNPIDKLAFVVGLTEIDRQIERRSARETTLLDIGQCIIAISCRLADSEQVQIRPI